MIPAFAFLVFSFTPVSPVAQTRYDYSTWSAVSDTLRDVEPGRRMQLRYPFIVPGSERVAVDSLWLEPGQYEIAYELGLFRLYHPLPPGSLVVVTYRRRPFLLKPVYSLRDVRISDPERPDTVVVRTSAPSTVLEIPKRNLVFGGSKSISFTMGSDQGTNLDQSLQASIEGELTPTIKVKAILSDNNLPIQPEGNTEELEYLDQVFVSIEGRNAKATLGDFGFENSVSTFSPITRQLKGASAEAWTGRGWATVAGAQSKGEYRTVQFRGTTGLQGPYELLSAARNTGEVVIAGTERVFVDGRRFVRGQNRDYTIDYDLGTVTFTPRMLITTDSEISVDFEATRERYDRSTVVAGAGVGILGGLDGKGGTGNPGKLGLSVLFARELDDKDNPQNVSLTEADLEVLGEAGDDPDQAIVSGVSPTEAGKGEYVLVPADTLSGMPTYFVFDDSTGDYVVAFVETGAGEGDYTLGGISKRGTRYYEFAGAGKGNYRVGKRLPLPESVTLITGRLRGLPSPHLSVDAEWNVSEHEKNQFSTLDDGDNRGDAGQLRLGLRALSLGSVRAGVSAAVNTITDRFKSFDKPRPSFFYRDWNLENVELSGRETIQEYGAELEQGQWAALVYTFGQIERAGVDGWRHEGTLRLGSDADRGFSGRGFVTEIDRAEEERTRRHATANAAWGLWRVRPSVQYSRERYLEDDDAAADSGYAFELLRLRLGDRSARTVNASVEFENRDTEEIRSSLQEWTDTRRDRTVTGALAVTSGGPLQGEFQVIHRNSRDLLQGSTQSTDLARLKGFLRSASAGLRADIDYEASRTAARTLQRSVIFVGEGNGDYNALGDLVGKGLGAYALVYSPTTVVVPTNRVDCSLRFNWKSTRGNGGAGAWAWIRSNVSLDQTIAVSEESTWEPAWEVYFLVPSALQRDSTTVFGSTSIRQDWSLLGGYPNVLLTFRYQRTDDEDNRFEGIGEERFLGEHLLRLSRSMSALLTLTAEVARDVRRRSGEGVQAGGGGVYDVTAYSGLGGVGLRLGGSGSVDFDFKITDQSDDVSRARQTLLVLRPRTSWQPLRTVSVFASYDLTQTWDREIAAARPVLFSAEGSGHRWSITPTLRVWKYVSVVATYQGRRETVFSGTRLTDHELRVETRAFF